MILKYNWNRNSIIIMLLFEIEILQQLQTQLL